MSLEGSEGLESQIEHNRLILTRKAGRALFEENGSVNEALHSSVGIHNAKFVIECVIQVYEFETGQVNLQSFFERLAGTSAEMEISRVTGRLGNTAERVLPNQLLGHAHNNGGLGLSHGFRTKGVRDLQNSHGTNVELVAFQQHREDLVFGAFEVHGDTCWVLEGVSEAQHA